VVLVVVAIVAAVFLSGTFMGINSLQSVWAKQGHYEYLCDTPSSMPEPPILVLPDAKCLKQAMKLLMLSHVASGVTYAMIPITGILTDWQGARRVFGGVILLLVLGNLIAIIPTYWTQFIGTTIMAGMGPCLAFNLLVWAQLVPGWTRWIVSIVTASFPGGSFFLGLLRVAVLQGRFSISGFFALWLLVSLPTLYLFLIWPRGIGKPYAASHPLLMLAYFTIARKIMEFLHIPIPDEADHNTVVELEEIYSNQPQTEGANPGDADSNQNDEEQVKLDFDAASTSFNGTSTGHTSHNTSTSSYITESPSSGTKKTSPNGDIESTTSAGVVPDQMVALDSANGIDAPKVEKIREHKWLDQLNSASIVLIQGYFLLVCVWLAVVSNLGAFRMTYWAQKTGGTQAGIDAHIDEAKAFLPHLETINIVSIFVAPVAAVTMKTIGVAGLSLITHIIATISALLCLSNSFDVQILNFYLFPVVRGLIYPFAMMFLIQTCGRRHLGLLWALTISGASPTDFIRTFLIKFWLYRSNAWDVLNGIQLIIIAIAWIWPVYVWIKRETWEEEHSEPLS
jgi:hypothetical protein